MDLISEFYLERSKKKHDEQSGNSSKKLSETKTTMLKADDPGSFFSTLLM